MGAKGKAPTSPVERILSKVVVTDSGCWEFQGHRLPRGYGQIFNSKIPGKPRVLLVHRVMYEAHIGPLGDLHVDHLCGNPPCCNPAHLDSCTQEENNYRTRLRGNHANRYGRTAVPV